jgi:histidinol-phosphatase (PHP family)
MERTCARAVEIGLPSVAFTEHVDFTPVTVGGRVRHLPVLDADGYLDAVARCRDRFPGLRILSGAELSEPHWDAARYAAFLDGRFDRVLGSVHNTRSGAASVDVSMAYDERPADAVVREYLAEVERLVRGDAAFEILAHLDFPLRYWPAAAGPYDIAAYEDRFREVLSALAASGRILEINTKTTLHPEIVRWWHEAGGDAVSFGSDAHEPGVVGRQFREAAGLAEAHGFRPGRTPFDPWGRF